MARFELKPSRPFQALLLFIHLLALLTLCFTSLALWARSSIGLLLVFSLFHHLYQHRASRRRWHFFTLDGRQVTVVLQDETELNGVVMWQTVVTGHCIVLSVRLEGSRFAARQVIFYDALPPDDFRTLRVRLRYS